MGKFYILKIETKSVWEVVDVDKDDPWVEGGWINAVCIDPGDERKARFGSKLGIPASTVFNYPNQYDVSKSPFHLTTSPTSK